MPVDRRTWPLMVRIGLWGLPNRVSAWAFFWLSIAIAAATVVYGFINPVSFVGGLMVFAGLWYYLSIKWVDQHSSWS